MELLAFFVLCSNPKEIAVLKRGVHRSSDQQEILVPWPWTDEAFVFDRNGLHVETRSLVTDSTLVKFHHDRDGALTWVSNKRKHSVTMERGNGTTSTVKLSLNGGSEHVLKPNSDGRLSSLTFPSERQVDLKYTDGGRLDRIVDDGKFVWQWWKLAEGSRACYDHIGLPCSK